MKVGVFGLAALAIALSACAREKEPARIYDLTSGDYTPQLALNDAARRGDATVTQAALRP
ncbi:MAG: hypothetical protein AB7M12_12545 [Hyphomonadaceae bacterium]